MTDLIERLSAATEGSRDLSDEVLVACGWKERHDRLWETPDKEWCHPDDRPNPTVSLDDALRLVPEGWIAYLEVCPAPYPSYATILYEPRNKWHGEAATAPLALCIAILRAKEAQRA